MRPIPTILSFSLLSFLVSASSQIAEAQQPTKVPRIGFLFAGAPSAVMGRIKALRQGLQERGYVEGKNIVIEYRYSDPVGSGFIASLARPGGNITGLSTLSPEISGKQMDLLKEILPKISRVAVVGNSIEPGNAQSLRETEAAAREFKVQLQLLDVLEPKDIETAFQAAAKARTDAILVLGNPFLGTHRKQISELAVKNRLPAIYPQSEFVEGGGLMTYAASRTDLFRCAATYVEKILKGIKPADLPVEEPKKFELVINLKAAKQIGLTIPPNVLARADRVIR